MNLSPAVAEREGTCPESLNAMAQPVGLSDQLEAVLQMHVILLLKRLTCVTTFDIISAQISGSP